MPVTPSAKKALRRDQRRTVKKIQRKRAVKNFIKKTLKAAEAGDMDKVKELLKKAQQAVDKAAKRGVIKKNTANRRKARLAARIKKIEKKEK